MLRKLLLVVAVAVFAAVVLLAPLPFGDVTRITNTVVIQRPPQAVFDYVTTPANWPKWHPASLGVSGATDHPLQLGEQTTEDFLVAGRRGQALWTVIDREAPQFWRIEATVEGRRAASVTYTLRPSGEGTRFERELIYPSRNLLFALLNSLSLREQVQAESTTAVERLKQRLEEGS